jgi:multidrug efflux pump subunit AcrB
MNYLLFVLVFIVGIYSYIKTPKEIFPSFELNMVSISGGYSGTSIDILDKMAVKDIEDGVKSIDGIKEMTTIISPARFNIILELENRVDRYNTADLVKDAVNLAKQNLPDDMNDPVVSVLAIKKSLMSVSILSDKVNRDKLIKKAEQLKDKIINLNNISDVTIYGNANLYFDIKLNSKKIEALGIDESGLVSALSGLSYIYPIGKIEDTKNGHFYISTNNGAKVAKDMLNMQIKVANQKLYLKDIADIQKRYEDSATKFRVDNKDAIDIAISQSRDGNALELSNQIKEIVKDLNIESKDFHYLIHNDKSEKIKDRLNIIVSNILLGLILITLLVMVLINARMSFVIMIGIPTSFVLGAFYLYVAGYK